MNLFCCLINNSTLSFKNYTDLDGKKHGYFTNRSLAPQTLNNIGIQCSKKDRRCGHDDKGTWGSILITGFAIPLLLGNDINKDKEVTE